ncbi:MAG: VWA domain-containing protein [Flavobacteriales bacterium]|nr:VWA domain-containing protein [Flavobacteriales bacterium]
MIRALLFGLSFLCVFHARAQSTLPTKTRILFLLDASGSMYARMDQDTRINIAKKLLSRMVDSLESLENLQIGLRVYGHQDAKEERNCRDTKLEVPFRANNHALIKERIKDIRPKGTTLIAYSLQEAAYDFPDANARNIIILITDGIEECDGDPCAVSQALQKQGVILKPFIIGVGLDAKFRQEFDCVGKYFEANTEEAFENVLGIVVSQALNNTTCQVNLLDTKGKPTETDVNISFFDHSNGLFVKNVVHTLNSKGLPDTIYLDPAYGYDVIAHTIPPVKKENVEILPGKHTIINMNTPQGYLKLEVDGTMGYGLLETLVYKAGTKDIIHVQNFNTTEPYITGTYDLEILTLPRIRQEGVVINQSKTTTLQIKQAGKVNIVTRTPVIGDIYRLKGGEPEWVCNVETTGRSEIITLQPGKYVLVVRSKREQNVINTKSNEFEITSGNISNINL